MTNQAIAEKFDRSARLAYEAVRKVADDIEKLIGLEDLNLPDAIALQYDEFFTRLVADGKDMQVAIHLLTLIRERDRDESVDS